MKRHEAMCELTRMLVLSAVCLASCKAHEPDFPAAPAPAPAPEVPSLACSQVALTFRPEPLVSYRARIDQNHQVYESTVSFIEVSAWWVAVESAFVFKGDSARPVGDIQSSKLLWRVEADGVPVHPPSETGIYTGELTPSLSLFLFRPVALPPLTSACVGTEWSRSWTRADRPFSYRYRVVSLTGGVARIHVEGSNGAPPASWAAEGWVEISVSDGFTGESHFHVRGPGAPRVNVFDRTVVISKG